VLADVAEMPRSALLAVHWETQEDSLLPALLSRRASVLEGIGEPLQLSLEAAFTSSPVKFCEIALNEGFLASAAHEDSGVGMSKAPLLINWLLGRMPLPLLSPGGGLYDRSAWVKHIRKTYMMRASLTSSSSEALDSEIGIS
jgi:hypothetical protein